jgi:hypothetical protein
MSPRWGSTLRLINWPSVAIWLLGDFDNELIVIQSPAGNNVKTEAEAIVGIRHQETTGEDLANWEDFICGVVTGIFEVCNSVRLS